MIRILVTAAVVLVVCRAITGKWPWEFLRTTSTRQQATLRARKLLGVREHAGHEEIVAAHRQLIAMVHPDRGGTNEQVHEANAARDLLLADIPYQS